MPASALVSHGLTHVGLVRQRNEDAFIERPEIGLWAVADGMGGHEAGDVASAAIVTALGAIEPPPDFDDFVDAIKDAMTVVDAALRERAASLKPSAVIASTVVILIVGENEIAALWAGDSRLYRRRDGKIRQLTVDHSHVQELVEAGRLSPAAAIGHPLSNIVTRAIGAGPVELAVLRDELRPADLFLLCSDGVTNMVSDAEIEHEIGRAAPRIAADALRDRVLARGAIDNLTIVIVTGNPVTEAPRVS